MGEGRGKTVSPFLLFPWPFTYTTSTPTPTHPPNKRNANLVPKVLSYPSLRSERQRDPGWVWSRGSRTNKIPREESFVSQFCVSFTQYRWGRVFTGKKASIGHPDSTITKAFSEFFSQFFSCTCLARACVRVWTLRSWDSLIQNLKFISSLQVHFHGKNTKK